MAGFGLGFGSHSKSRQYSALGQNVPPSVLRPSLLWNGTAGSGFGGVVPVDPARTTAKPAMRLLIPPSQFFTNELVIGVWAGANHSGSLLDNLGLDKVIVHCEGESIEIAAPSFFLFDDGNGATVRYFGWWAVLQHPGSNGHAQVYFEAVPKDATMQNRVIGPYQFSPQAVLHDFDIEIAATPAELPGVRYKTFLSAFNYLRTQAAQNPRITVSETADYDLGTMPAVYSGEGHCLIEASVPITIKKPGFAMGTAARLFRPRYDGLWFRGANITIDFLYADSIYHENSASSAHVFDGVNFTDSGGDYYTYLLGPKTTFQIARNAPYFLECAINSITGACNNSGLVRGCTIEGASNDAAQAALCVIGTTIRNWNSDVWREEIPALSVQYTGAGATATLSLSGINLTDSRVFTAKVGGATAGTFTLSNTQAGFTANTNYTVQNVVSWLNSLPGWTATLLDNTRYAAALSVQANQGGAFTDLNVKTAKSLVAVFDLHPDLWQHVGPTENRIFVFNNCYNNVVQSVFLNNPSKDLMVIGSTFHQDPASSDSNYLLSQFNEAHSHVVMAHNCLANQALHLRTDVSYDPDGYCLVANNVMPAIIWGGAANANIDIVNNHLLAGATAPSGAIGTTIGGTMTSVFINPASGNFLQQGILLGIFKTPVIRYDLAGSARPVPALLGALAGPDAIAPAITSSNPSGTFPENLPIAGTATANKPVTWSVTGTDAGAVNIDPNSGTWSINPTDFESQTSYAFNFVATDSLSDTAVQVVAISVTDVDEFAPVLTNIQATATGTSGATLSVITNEGNGTLYWFVTTSPAAPSAATLISGTGATAGGSQIVAAGGTYAPSISGLSASTTYYAYFLHRDLAGNNSAIGSSGSFTTSAFAGGNISVVSSAVALKTSDTAASYVASPFTYAGGTGRVLVAVVTISQQAAQTIGDLTATVGGVPMTRIAGAAHSGGASRPICGVFIASGLASGSKTITVQVNGNGRSCTVLALEVAGANTATLLANALAVEGNTLTYGHSYTPTAAGNLVLCALATRQGDRGPFTPDAGVIELLDESTGATATSDHSAFSGYVIPAATNAINVGASTTLSSDMLFVVAELRKA